MIITIALLTAVFAFPKYKQSLLTSKPETLKKLAYQLQIATDLSVDVDQDQICNWLKDYTISSAPDFYHSKLASSLLEDCQLEYDEVPVLEQDDFESLYYTSLASGHCPKLQDYLTPGGAAKPNLKKQEDSYRTAAQLYHLASICNDESVGQGIQEAIFNFQQIYEGVTGTLERDNSAAITAQILYAFFQLDIQILHPKIDTLIRNQIYQETILNFLLHRANTVVGNIEEQFWITRLFTLEEVKSIIYPVFQDYYASKGQAQINVRFTNLQGEKVKLNEVKATLDGEILTYVPLKSKEFSGYFETDKIGQYNIQIEFQNYTLTYPVKVLQEPEIDEVLFDIVDSKTAKPNFKHGVDLGEMYRPVLNANERSYLHVILKIKPAIKAQVAIRLVHPQYPTATTQVLAEYDSKKKIYYGIVDFGDPDHIIPLNAVYKAEILIADAHIVPKRWNFLQIDTKFQAQTTFQNDSSYKLPQEIHHQFSQDQPEIPFIFVSFFVIVILLAFGFYLKMLSGIQINFDKLPSGSSLYLVYLFLGLIVALFLILTLFWIKLNLIETVTLLGILSVPLVIVGNYALLALKPDEKVD